MNLGSVMMLLGDKGCQGLLRQGGKNCKIKVIDLTIEYFDLPGHCFFKLNLY